jgi:hypothetical protein
VDVITFAIRTKVGTLDFFAILSLFSFECYLVATEKFSRHK